jgi:hypothetical protein
VSVKTGTGSEGAKVSFLMQNWGRSSKYETGTQLRVPCPGDGTEVLLKLEEAMWSGDDISPGKFAFEFSREGELATASIIFYLNDGYYCARSYNGSSGCLRFAGIPRNDC